MIHHLPAEALCGTFAFSSVTIVETENKELIRVLDLCNVSNEFKPNQEIKIIPQDAPKFDVIFAFEFVENKKTKEVEISSNYDTKILRTCWGTLSK